MGGPACCGPPVDATGSAVTVICGSFFSSFSVMVSYLFGTWVVPCGDDWTITIGWVGLHCNMAWFISYDTTVGTLVT